MKYLLLIVGLALTIISFLARTIGFDQNDSWGASRILMLLIGIFFIVLFAFRSLNFAKYIHPKYQTTFNRLICSFLKIISSKITAIIIGVVSILIILIFSVWITSAGMMNDFPKVTNYYKDLADAFLHGQVSMLVIPDARLSELVDPYDQQSRLDIPTIHDWSYFRGKYYLYWGPVPAVIFMVLRIFGILDPAGQLAILFFYVGIAIVLCILLYSLWRDYFPKAWGGYVGLILLFSCISLPYSFLLGRPQIYETSIIAGQFFLTSGVLFWYKAMKLSNKFLFTLAGFSWGLAIGSRYNLALSVGILIVFSGCLFIRKWGKFHHYIQYVLSLLTPIFLVVICLGVYNYLRFGNIFETGFSYQFTLSVLNNQYYSINYLKSSIYYYLSYPLTRISNFPIIEFPRVNNGFFPEWATPAPGKAFDESGTGILRSFPLFYIAILIFPLGIYTIVQIVRKNSERFRLLMDKPKWITQSEVFFIFLIIPIFQLFFLCIYFYGAMRFTLDFFISMVIVVFLIILKIDQLLSSYRALRLLFGVVIVFLGVNAMLIGVFGGINVPPQVFRHGNPEGYRLLRTTISPYYAAFREIANSNGLGGLLIRLFLRVFY